jgi:hypothetical protein
MVLRRRRVSPSVGDADISPLEGEIDRISCASLKQEPMREKNDLPLEGEMSRSDRGGDAADAEPLIKRTHGRSCILHKLEPSGT